MPGPQDPSLIAVMGPTGVGKSTFINLASDSAFRVSNGLKSCTFEVTATEAFLVNGKAVVLLDTPGFDDTKSSDFDILEQIADYMARTYQENKLLDGILYFHNISSMRMGGIAVRNLRMFESLCGNDPLKSVVVVTNMWGLLPDAQIGYQREKELKEDKDFFGHVLGGGASLMRHNHTKESTHQILSKVLNVGNQENKLTIQAEMVDEDLRLEETSAAAELIRDFDAMIQNLRRRIEREERAMAGASPRERRQRQKTIKQTKIKIKELEDYKVKIRKKNSPLWFHQTILRWFKAKFMD
ncbi:hypothetical protein CPB86DRAFT_756523 [Serendipita vermifera]|nr:hypothetical protein CPB86DRAFT_756523 [Serendipita vermifera]